MKQYKRLLAGALCLSINLGALAVAAPQMVFAQDTKVALQRGYRTGYSDGYMAGYRDTLDNAAKDFAHHGDYDKASRAYNKEYGTVDDYRDGYRQGFELGYATGYDKRSFEAKVPEDLGRRGLAQIPAQSPVSEVSRPAVEPVTEPVATSVAAPINQPTADTSAPETQPVPAAVTEPSYSDSTPRTTPGTFAKTTFTPVSDAVIIIQKDTELILELNDELTTQNAHEGQKFTAKIVSPTEIAGAIVEGHVAKLTKPGRIKRRSEMQLSFDRIILTETRWSNFDAVLTEVLPVRGDNIKSVDNEGLAVGKRSYKSDAVKIGAATGTGVTIGAIAGGPVGAAVGAGVGAAFGVGAVVIERGKHIKLNPNQQLRVRTSFETQIR